MNLKREVNELTKRSRLASFKIASLSSDTKNKILLKMARGLERNISFLKQENEKDIKSAHKKNISPVLIDRLRLTPKIIKEMALSLRDIAGLPDPVGEIIKMWKRPNGLRIGKIRIPIGVIAIIYESRPNVTSDCAGLCLKSGNAVILRGGSEAFNSNRAILSILNKAGGGILPPNAIRMIPTTNREALNYLLKASGDVDLLIPRGGESLIKYVSQKAKMPVIKHYKGVCHIYVDEYADIDKALKIAYNAKVQRPAVCNAMETMLVHKNIALRFLPLMLEKFRDAGVEIRACKETKKIVPWVKSAQEQDWYAEYLDLILAVKIVDSIEEAIEHIRKYGSSHSDAIVTESYTRSGKFLQDVDSACVYVNASTRFTDGYQFGMGAEMGISTDKFHARGPMALEELTSYKYIILGNGQIRK